MKKSNLGARRINMHRVRQTIISTFALLSLLAVTAPPIRAAEDGAARPALPRTQAEADAQRDAANQLRASADEAHALETAACAKKILVNGCLADAKERHTAAVVAARELDAQVRDFEREARRADVAAKEAQRAADNAQRKRDQEEQAAAYRAEQAKKTAEREKKLADRAARNRKLDTSATPEASSE